MRPTSRLLLRVLFLLTTQLLVGCPAPQTPPGDPDGGTLPSEDGGAGDGGQPGGDAGPPGSWGTSTWDNASWQ
jgi:hypothetical protein